MYNLSAIEILTVELMKYFEKISTKHHGKPVYCYSRAKDPRISLFFNKFKDLILTSIQNSDVLPDPKIFIKSQFEIMKMNRLDIEIPVWICFDYNSWDRYKRYIEKLYLENGSHKIKKHNSSYIVNVISKTQKFLEKCQKFEDLFEKEESIIFFKNKMISPYYLSISKKFFKIKNIHPKIKKEMPEDFSIYREEIKSYPKILDNISNIMKDDYSL